MIQEWFDSTREWLAARQQRLAQRLADRGHRRMERRDVWRQSIGRPWRESVCWWCLVAITAVIGFVVSWFRS